MNKLHIPVMENEVIKYLNILDNGIYLDCTFGCGGHSKKILSKLGINGKLFVSDEDINSIKIAENIRDKRLVFNNFSFINFKNYLNKLKLLGKINGIILDLGLSNYQIFDNTRGFSFSINGILDMRFNINKGIPAFKWLQKSTSNEINNIFNKFGEEYKYSKRISEEIVIQNKKKLITTTKELVNIITKIHKKNKKIHPATKYFQAIRMHINNELSNIKRFLKDVIKILDINGRLVVIGFNSLEIRIIKNFFNFKNTEIMCLPLTIIEEKNIYNKNNKYFMKKIIKLKPSREEIKFNSKSRSAILTVFEKKINFY